ncbi:hypothetical protein VTN77DRAFT_7894 [Rasamsonia byssochlamydoides]|uniref:uncharacterized protein n=1 Tax=Rasamsonia byssochlamydoides TaxID=89139 RepID=UPI0037423B17
MDGNGYSLVNHPQPSRKKGGREKATTGYSAGVAGDGEFCAMDLESKRDHESSRSRKGRYEEERVGLAQLTYRPVQIWPNAETGGRTSRGRNAGTAEIRSYQGGTCRVRELLFWTSPAVHLQQNDTILFNNNDDLQESTPSPTVPDFGPSNGWHIGNRIAFLTAGTNQAT